MVKDNRPYHVFVIKTDGTIEHTTQPKAPKLDQLQKAVEGYIETVSYWTSFTYEGVKYSRGTAYANEEGLIKRMPENRPASLAWRLCYPHASASVLHGPCIFYAKEPKPM